MEVEGQVTHRLSTLGGWSAWSGLARQPVVIAAVQVGDVSVIREVVVEPILCLLIGRKVVSIFRVSKVRWNSSRRLRGGCRHNLVG